MIVNGALAAGGDIQVDGKVQGDITSGSLTVGEKAVVEGEILAEEVIVRGKIVGSSGRAKFSCARPVTSKATSIIRLWPSRPARISKAIAVTRTTQ